LRKKEDKFIKRGEEMNIHNSVQPFYRYAPTAGFRQQVRRKKTFAWPGDRMLWISVGKILLVLCPLVLIVNLWLGASFRNLESSVREVENARLELMDKQIKLRAQRAQLYSPEHIQLMAAEKFSLRVPDKDQVKLF
jgi:hypothetical protein